MLTTMPSFLYSQLFVTPPYPTASFAGQTVVVTGSNVGLGFEAARHFARLDAAKVILAVRNLKAGEQAKSEIESSTKRSVCEVWELDLASYDSVKAFAKRVGSLSRLNIVVENAAIATSKYTLAEQDERTITVNVVSTFLLALLLLPKLKSTAEQIQRPTKLTIVTSEVHGWVSLDEVRALNTFQALQDNKDMRGRYGISKFLGVCAVREMAPLLKDSGVVVNMINPGFCHSSIDRDGKMFMKIMRILLARSTEAGSRTLLLGAAAGPESHGSYMSDGKVANDMIAPFLKTQDGQKAQRKIWEELKQKLEMIEPGVTEAFTRL